MFLATFEGVDELITDESGQVRQAAAFLNQTLKSILNDATGETHSFQLRSFVEILAEKLESGSPASKEFILDWFMTIEEVPQFELTFDLPLFYRQMF